MLDFSQIIWYIIRAFENNVLREWLSGRALPCQGKCREFESRLPLHFFKWCHRQVVRPRSAKPLFPSSNLGGTSIRRDGGIGRRKGLKIPRGKLRTGSSPVPGTKFIRLQPRKYKAFILC